MINEKDKQKLVDEYIREKHNTDECYGFCEALDRVMSMTKPSKEDLENRIKIIKLLQIIRYVDSPLIETSEWNDYFIHNPYLGNITNILVRGNKITLICLSPRLVIGKGGKNFNHIKQQIELNLGQEFEYEIVEDSFWNVY